MSDNTTVRYAEFILNEMRFALPVSVILDLGQLQGLTSTKMPGGPEMIDRVVNHRGRVVPVVDLRKVCGFEPVAGQVQKMEELLRAREQDHVNWLTALSKTVDEGVPFTLARDPHACEFGKWYDQLMANDAKRASLTKNDLALEAVLREFDLPHSRIHAIADHVLGLVADGKRMQAKQEIEEAWDGDFAVMKRLFARMLVLFRDARQPQLVVMDLDGVSAGLMVDDILSVVEYKTSDIHPVPVEARTQAPVVGIAETQDNDDGMVSFLDPAGIIAAVMNVPGLEPEISVAA